MSKLTKREKDIIVGSLLGDECMRILGGCKNPVFCVSHSKAEKNYVFWKYEQLKRFVNTPPWQESRVYHKDRSRRTFSWRFQTLSNVIFSDLYKIFYPAGEKIVPEKLVELLSNSPLSLAIWLMDDGNKNKNAVFINTQSFSFAQQQFLVKVLKKAFNLDATINKHSMSKGKQLYRIRISTASTRKLPKLVGRFILPEFRYKIPTLSP